MASRRDPSDRTYRSPAWAHVQVLPPRCATLSTRGAAAILAYRLILFWLPLILGGPAFASLFNGQKHAEPLNVGDRCPWPVVAL